MSILNRPSDGLFNILVVFARCLAQHGSMDRGKLIKVCAPVSAVDSQERAKQTLNNWIQLGLLNDKEGKISIDRSLSSEIKKTFEHGHLALACRQRVLAVENNQRFWEAEDNGSSDFCRAASWMLAQNVFDVEVVGHKAVEEIEVQQLREFSAFTNDTRWAGFKAWASFLGFGWIGRYPNKNTFVIDPTTAVSESLAEVFGKSKELAQEQFFRTLADVLPVIDGGVYRSQVEEKIDRASWKEPKSSEISTSLSRALSRLHEREEIQLENRADAIKRTLLGRNNRPLRNVSHIIWKGGKK
ncbi:protein DpdG [Blastopirellula marina]|uniref:Uncharacterized protein n=1 Tax=Blastopirellula marina DSM 3645 TaxID=314230 RepID=A3ZSC3_9BACT|nr:protein DpdG [Blastopirellula marina]EAQ80583.1 hypothetical protein DSM3645_14595 [Blastopirellula marina DSM 3645]